MSQDSSERSFERGHVAKPKKTKYGRYVKDITREEIESVFYLPAEEACVKLGICLTILKRLCRKFGIQRWPYRRLKCTMRLQQQGLREAENAAAKKALAAPQQVMSIHRAAELLSDPQVLPSRPERPRRQASLGVKEAVGRAKEEYHDTEVPTVVARRPNMSYSKSMLDNPYAPAVPDRVHEELAKQSITADESQVLSALMEVMHRPSVQLGSVPSADAVAVHGLPTSSSVTAGSGGFRALPKQEPGVGPAGIHPQPQDSGILKGLESALQRLVETSRQQQQQQAAARAAYPQNDLIASLLQSASYANVNPDHAAIAKAVADLTAALARTAQPVQAPAWPSALQALLGSQYGNPLSSSASIFDGTAATFPNYNQQQMPIRAATFGGFSAPPPAGGPPPPGAPLPQANSVPQGWSNMWQQYNASVNQPQQQQQQQQQ